jgi:actin related protein 2/3 complex subunit 2
MSTSTSSKGMIFIDSSHPIISETLKQKLAPDAKQEPVDITCADFDDVTYRIVVESKALDKINFTLSMPYLKDLMPMGATALLDGPYGKYKSNVKGSDATFTISAGSDPNEVAELFGNLKRNLLAAPFKKAFDALADGKVSALKPMVIPFRPKERIVLNPTNDRVQVYFYVEFDDETDRAIAKVFLQEFSESQRKIPQAPAVTFTYECPGDLAKVKEFKPRKSSSSVGYLMFQMFTSHVDSKEKRTKAITLFQGFRAYLHYHIKASKAYLHSRMRNRVDSLLMVLKRADPNPEQAHGKKAFRVYKH